MKVLAWREGDIAEVEIEAAGISEDALAALTAAVSQAVGVSRREAERPHELCDVWPASRPKPQNLVVIHAGEGRGQ